MNEEEDRFMKDYAKLSELRALLDKEQEEAFHYWKNSNNVSELEVATSPTTIMVSGKGWLQGVCVGQLSIAFINSNEMKETYKKELARGFAKFVQERVEKKEEDDNEK